jgi:integrase
MQPVRRAGRPSKYAKYDQLLASLPKTMEKRPKYVRGIGLFRGSRGITAWLKIRLPNGGTLRGKTYAAGTSLEIKVGNFASWDWERLNAKHAELQGKADRGEALEDAPDVTFVQVAEDWLARVEKRARAFETERIAAKKYLIPSFGKTGLKQLSTSDVNRWIAERRGVAKASTVQRQFNTLRAILNDAVRSGLIEKSPTLNADPIRGAVARQRFLTVEELVALLAIAEKEAEWLPDFILWAVHSGMRKGEIQALRWSDVRELGPDRVVINVARTKTGKPRFVVATKTMREILERQKARRIAGDDRVFAVSKMTLRRRWEAARASAGLQDVTIHDLRRTHTTHAAASGVDLRTLAGRIGHADLTMIERVYAQVMASASEEAAEKIEKAFALGPGLSTTAEGASLRKRDSDDRPRLHPPIKGL